MARRRYQQGIWTEAPYVAPTYWKDPKAPEVRRFDLPRTTVGVTRNYSAGESKYLDTQGSRWWVSPSMIKVSQNRGKGQAQAQVGVQASGTSLTSPQRTGFPAPTEFAPPRVTDVPQEAPPPMLAKSSKRRTTGLREPGAAPPPIAGTGLAVPPPPASGRKAPVFPVKGAEFDFPPQAGTVGEDPFMTAIRNAPAEPISDEGRWRNDPDMPTLSMPRPTSTEMDMGEQNLAAWMAKGSPASRVPRSRTQSRTPKNDLF